MNNAVFKPAGNVAAMIALLLAALAWCAHSAAVDRYYDGALPLEYLSVSHAEVQASGLSSVAPEQVEISVNELSASWRLVDENKYSVALGTVFEYTILGFDSLPAMSNGHLHSWRLPLVVKVNNAMSTLFYNLTPVISVSSNVLRNPELADRQGLQLDAGFVYRRQLSSGTSWIAGIKGDHDFGEYRLYPVAGFIWQPGGDWIVQLAYPDSIIRKQVTPAFSYALYVEPRGNKWHVFSKDKTRDSDIVYEEIISGLSFTWQPLSEIGFRLDIERHAGRRLELALDDGSLVRTDVESGGGIILNGFVNF